MGDVDIDVSEGLLGGAFSFQISLMGARGARSGGAAGERRSVRSLVIGLTRSEGADAFAVVVVRWRQRQDALAPWRFVSPGLVP